MRKFIFMALFCLGLVIESFGQTTISRQEQQRLDSLSIVKRQFNMDLKSARFNCKTSSNVLMKSYSDHLIVEELFKVSGAVFTIIGLNMTANRDKAGETFTIVGGSMIFTGYCIHLSSLGNLRKYAFKRHKEELKERRK